MKIVIAPDKFKGSLTALEFCHAVEDGILKTKPQTEIIKLPLADGGDGTLEVVNYYLSGKEIYCEVNNPFFKKIKASYLYSEDAKTAYIEMAEASGIKLLNDNQLDCKNTSTFGTGELIQHALEKGAKTIILGIGGSATNDCGIGMASALGYRFLDKNNNEVHPVGKNLSEIAKIDESKVDPRLKNTVIHVACDVTNPLYGKNGAAYIYAAQKGATTSDLDLLDKGLRDFSGLIEKKYDIDPQKVKGAGAAGGMGIASKVFLNAELLSGIDLIMSLANFDHHLKNADWIITGEGKLDQQTLSGKTIYGVVDRATRKKVKVAVICGANELSTNELDQFGILYSDNIIQRSTDLEDALANAKKYLQMMASDFANKRLN